MLRVSASEAGFQASSCRRWGIFSPASRQLSLAATPAHRNRAGQAALRSHSPATVQASSIPAAASPSACTVTFALPHGSRRQLHGGAASAVGRISALQAMPASAPSSVVTEAAKQQASVTLEEWLVSHGGSVSGVRLSVTPGEGGRPTRRELLATQVRRCDALLGTQELYACKHSTPVHKAGRA